MGRFQKGNKFGTGRPKGSMSKRTLEFVSTLEDNNYDAALTLMELQREAYENYEKYKDDKKDQFKASAYFKEACNLAGDIAGYVYAKPKSIEITAQNPFEEMNAAERLEAMREAVKMLEQEIEIKEVKQLGDSNQGDCT